MTTKQQQQQQQQQQQHTGPDKRRCVPCACSVTSVDATSTLGKCHTM